MCPFPVLALQGKLQTMYSNEDAYFARMYTRSNILTIQFLLDIFDNPCFFSTLLRAHFREPLIYDTLGNAH